MEGHGDLVGWPVACTPVGMTLVQEDPVVGQIIGASIAVHHSLGPGLLESTYEACVVHELIERGIRVERQVPVPLLYKGMRLDCGYRLDLLVESKVIVEIKSVEKLLPIHTAQVLTYLRLTGAPRALLMNFNEVSLKKGLRSFLGYGSQRQKSWEPEFP